MILNADQCESLKANADFKLEWGSFGKNLDQTCRYRTLESLDTDHLENILIACPHITEQYKASILMLLKKRYLSLERVENV